MKRNNKKGFTIVELVIVIAVIAILSAVLIPTFAGITEKAQASKAQQEVKNAYTATLANDLSTPDTTDDVVYNKGVVVVAHSNGVIVSIDANGVPSIAATGTAATHTMANGVLTPVSNAGTGTNP